jgi:hypothetical protein
MLVRAAASSSRSTRGDFSDRMESKESIEGTGAGEFRVLEERAGAGERGVRVGKSGMGSFIP